jgi:cytoskeletal protein RodZ
VTDQVHKLGEVLRAAREAKGVDLPRVERETKIRERYLSALERAEYRELPGSVYTKGFLRNYGAYLGLDPEYLIDLYRLETSTAVERPSAPAPPRPIGRRQSRTFVVTPTVMVAAILTVFVGAFIAYVGYNLVQFARQPELRITDPPGPVSNYTELTMTLRGVTEPNASVVISNLRENPTVRADADGNFEVTVELVPGSNVVRLMARDPRTNRDSAIEERAVVVVTETAESPTPAAVALTVTEPAADATSSGEVTIAGTAAPGATVAASAALAEPPVPTFEVADPAGTSVPVTVTDPGPPEPVMLTADASGAFTGTLGLRPGAWDLTIVTDGVDPVVRRVRVSPGDGLAARVRTDGGDSYLELEEDGSPVADVSGGIASDGDAIDLAADDELRIRAGNAGAVRLTVNGVDIGFMGEDGAVVEWRITRTDG